jgi:phosphate-selective porin OprO/OprP
VRGFGTSCSQLIWQAIAVCSLLLLAANNTWAEHSLELQRRWTFDASEQSLLELPPTKLAGAATGSDVATGAAVLSPAEIEALGVPSVRWTGQVQLDSVWFSQSDQSREVIGPLLDGVSFRRARLGAFGELHELIQYRIEVDFALSGRPSFLDNWVSLSDLGPLGNVRIGHAFEPFGLERLTPNRFSTFMERSVVDLFAPARNTGVMIWNHALDGDFTWAAGAFRSASDLFGNDVGNSSAWAGTGRITYSPGFNPDDRRYLLHFGAAYSVRGVPDGQLRFRERPEIRVGTDQQSGVPFVVDTETLETNLYQLVGTEIAVVRNSLSLQSEYVLAPVELSDGSWVGFQGVYAMASYFLTGEHRRYFRTRAPFRKNNGVFDRVIPNTQAFVGPRSREYYTPGPGAWEVAARWSHLNANSGPVRGGQMSSVTLGLNWYLNPYSRVQWNYVRPRIDDPELGLSRPHIFGMRIGLDF